MRITPSLRLWPVRLFIASRKAQRNIFGQLMFDLLYYLRWNTTVPARLNEFAILVVGRQWRSQVEWAAHAPALLFSHATGFNAQTYHTLLQPLSDKFHIYATDQRGQK